MKNIFILLVLTLALFACSNVKPWQKGNLAKSHMAFDTDPVETRYMQHVYTSKEGSHGGYGVAGGGCGCN